MEKLDPQYFALKEWRHWTFDVSDLAKGMRYFRVGERPLAGRRTLAPDEVCSVHVTSTGNRQKVLSLRVMLGAVESGCAAFGGMAPSKELSVCCDLGCGERCGPQGCTGDESTCCPRAILSHGSVCSSKFPNAPCVLPRHHSGGKGGACCLHRALNARWIACAPSLDMHAGTRTNGHAISFLVPACRERHVPQLEHSGQFAYLMSTDFAP